MNATYRTHTTDGADGGGGRGRRATGFSCLSDQHGSTFVRQFLSRMALKLTWDDLLIQNFTEPDVRTWLGNWPGQITGRVAPVFLSKFGDWFLRRPDGSTDEFSVIDGTYSQIASTPEEFATLVNTLAWQEQHLLSLLVTQLHERGIIPAPGQCYALTPHPLVLGRIDISQVMLMDINVWQSLCSQLFTQLNSKK